MLKNKNRSSLSHCYILYCGFCLAIVLVLLCFQFSRKYIKSVSCCGFPVFQKVLMFLWLWFVPVFQEVCKMCFFGSFVNSFPEVCEICFFGSGVFQFSRKYICKTCSFGPCVFPVFKEVCKIYFFGSGVFQFSRSM